jgi:hypothetical protein
MTSLEQVAAVAAIVSAVVGIIGLLKWKEWRSVQSGSHNVQGDVNASSGGLAVGHGSSVYNINTGDPEVLRRRALIEELLRDYIHSHDQIPVEAAKMRLQAEPYVNCRLTEMGEQWRFDGQTGHAVEPS